MKKLLWLALLCVAFQCPAQLLWKVSGGDLPKPSYVFGTFHAAPGKFIDKVPGLQQVIHSVDAIMVEVREAEMNDEANQALSVDAMYAPADSTLDVVFSPEEYREVDSLLRSATDDSISLNLYDGYKPIVITQSIANEIFNFLMDSNSDGTEILDAAVERAVTALGKPSYSLDTFEYQLQLLYQIPLREQADDLIELLTNYEGAFYEASRLAIAYFMQDLDAVTKVAGNSPTEMDFVDCAKRNRAWVPKILNLARKQSVLVSVGAAHLGDPETGIIHLLRKEGYTVEPF